MSEAQLTPRGVPRAREFVLMMIERAGVLLDGHRSQMLLDLTRLALRPDVVSAGHDEAALAAQLQDARYLVQVEHAYGHLYVYSARALVMDDRDNLALLLAQAAIQVLTVYWSAQGTELKHSSFGAYSAYITLIRDALGKLQRQAAARPTEARDLPGGEAYFAGVRGDADL